MDAGVGLKEQAAVLTQGSSDIDRQGDRWEIICSLNRPPDWDGVFSRWLRKVTYVACV